MAVRGSRPGGSTPADSLATKVVAGRESISSLEHQIRLANQQITADQGAIRVCIDLINQTKKKGSLSRDASNAIRTWHRDIQRLKRRINGYRLEIAYCEERLESIYPSREWLKTQPIQDFVD